MINTESLIVFRDTNLFEIRCKLWENLKDSEQIELKTPDKYIFTSVTQDSQNVEYFDYSLKLSDLNLLHWFFKLIEIEGNIEEIHYNSDISNFFSKNCNNKPTIIKKML